MVSTEYLEGENGVPSPRSITVKHHMVLVMFWTFWTGVVALLVYTIFPGDTERNEFEQGGLEYPGRGGLKVERECV